MNYNINIKKIKFDDQRINKFFNKLNKSKVGTGIYSVEFGGYEKFFPITAIKLNLDELAEIKAIKANVIFMLSAGTKYSGWPKHVKTDEERIQEAQPKIAQLVIELNQLLNSSDDQLFAMLKCECVNRSYSVCITHRDRGDDGDDNYGIMVFLKFSYK